MAKVFFRIFMCLSHSSEKTRYTGQSRHSLACFGSPDSPTAVSTSERAGKLTGQSVTALYLGHLPE